MANIEEAIRRLKYLYEVHGADQVAAAQAAVTASTTTTEKASLSLEKSFNNLERRYVSTVKAQQDYQKVQEKVNDAVKQNPALQERGNAILANANQQYLLATQGLDKYGKAITQSADSSRLARYELINLSRQFQDVGVSLASGQSPFTVLIQQGTQIADVFANTTGTVKGFFGQAVAGARGFLGTFAGAATVVGALGAGIVYVANQYAAAQLDIERALAGIGAAAGVTREQLNKIASESATAFGLSTKEAREAAVAFVSTGEISGANIAKATAMVKDFARATGTDATEATKRLAAAMVDPAKGALDLDKTLGALDATTINYIRSLQAQGKEQEAIAAMLDKLRPKVEKQAEYVQGLPLLWQLASNAASNYYGWIGKIALQGPLPQIKPPEIKPPGSGDGGQNETDLNNMSKKADAAALSIMGVTAQITAMQTELSKISKYREAISGPVTVAEQVGNVRLRELQEQEQALARQVQLTQQIAALYPGMSIEVAKQLSALQGQLTVAQARTGAEQMIAQEYVTQNNLLMQGKTLVEASAIAAGQREIAEANVSKSIADQIHGLEDQIALSNARLSGNEELTKAQQAYTNAIRDGADEADAAALRKATYRNEEQQRTEQITNQLRQESDAAQGVANAQGRVAMQTYQVVDAFKAEMEAFNEMALAERIDNRLSLLDTQFEKGKTYTSTYDPLWTYQQKLGLEASVGAQNVEPTMVFGALAGYQIKQSYFDTINQQQRDQMVAGLNVSSPAAIQVGLQQLLPQSGGDLTAVNRLIGVAAPSQQASLIQQTIDYIRQTEPPGLATEEKIQDLNNRLEQLTSSTDSLNATMQSALSPFYSQDPRTTKLGFRAGVTGNPDWMTGAGNANPLVAVLGPGATAPGMAAGGSFVVGGGYSANDNRMAVFPVASGEEIVVNRNQEGRTGQVVHIDNRIFVSGSVDNDTLSKMKVSRYQQAQRMRAGMAQA